MIGSPFHEGGRGDLVLAFLAEVVGTGITCIINPL